MATRDEETYVGEHVRNIGILYLHYKRSLERAKQKLLSYHAKLDPGVDERLNDAACLRLMDKLLAECFKRAEIRLRDGLGLFYNLCHDPDQDHAFLNSENAEFVNEVFQRFVTEFPREGAMPFLLDRQEEYRNHEADWKEVIQDDFPYACQLEEILGFQYHYRFDGSAESGHLHKGLGLGVFIAQLLAVESLPNTANLGPLLQQGGGHG